MQESPHDEYRRRKALADSGGNYRAWEGGKGDMDRSSHTTPFKLGMDLIEIAESHGKDSKEYKKCLAAWRKAVRESL